MIIDIRKTVNLRRYRQSPVERSLLSNMNIKERKNKRPEDNDSKEGGPRVRERARGWECLEEIREGKKNERKKVFPLWGKRWDRNAGEDKEKKIKEVERDYLEMWIAPKGSDRTCRCFFSFRGSIFRCNWGEEKIIGNERGLLFEWGYNA